MKIKVGQWVRTIYGEVVKVLNLTEWCKKGNDYKYYTAVIDKKMLYTGFNETRPHTEITKVANTPQELIEVGDLVGTDWYNEISSIWRIDEDGLLWKDIDDYIELCQVTKILTPNGKDYICQWEVVK